eukprot:6062030-Amphidinium_carterae.2
MYATVRLFTEETGDVASLKDVQDSEVLQYLVKQVACKSSKGLGVLEKGLPKTKNEWQRFHVWVSACRGKVGFPTLGPVTRGGTWHYTFQCSRHNAGVGFAPLRATHIHATECAGKKRCELLRSCMVWTIALGWPRMLGSR